jgi:hypothetical protein
MTEPQGTNRLGAIRLPAGYRRFEPVLGLVCIWLAVVSVGLLAAMARDRALMPGYDFRYFWLAGELWWQGVSPYGPVFGEAGARLITSGNIPEIWPYPPNLWLPSVALAQFDLTTAWQVWLCIQLAAVPAASAALAAFLPLDMLPGSSGHKVRVTRLGFFCLHTLLMASVEAIQLSVYVGQSSVLVYLGAVLVVCGLSGDRRALVWAGLVMTFMKPQIGAVLAVGLMLSGREGIRAVFAAALISVLLILPPMAMKAGVVFDWLRSVADYDGASPANVAAAMTGIRNLVWTYAEADIGNIVAMGLTLAVSAGVTLHHRRALTIGGAGWRCAAPDLMIAQLLVILGFSPLHMYDFTLFGVAVLAAAGATGLRLLAAGIGAALFMQPSDLFVWFHGERASTIFPGSTLATIGAIVLLLVVLTRKPSARMVALARPAV